MRHRLTPPVLVGALILVSAPVFAQIPSTDEKLWGGNVAALGGPGLPGEWYFPECSSGSSVGVALAISRRIAPLLTLSADVALATELGIGNCPFALPPPPEPYTETRFTSIGHRFMAPSLRLALAPPLREGAVVRPRVFAGAGILRGGGTPFLVSGLTFHLGQQSSRSLVLGIEMWYADVPVERTYLRMEGSVELDRLTERYSEATWTQLIRVGITL